MARRDRGQVRLVRWHRTVGGWPIGLIALHVVFITIGYAQASHVGALSEFWTFLVHYPDMLTATVALCFWSWPACHRSRPCAQAEVPDVVGRAPLPVPRARLAFATRSRSA